MYVKDLIVELQKVDPYGHVRVRDEGGDYGDMDRIVVEEDYYPERGNNVYLTGTG